MSWALAALAIIDFDRLAPILGDWIQRARCRLPDIAPSRLVCKFSVAWHRFPRVVVSVEAFIAVEGGDRLHGRAAVRAVVGTCKNTRRMWVRVREVARFRAVCR